MIPSRIHLRLSLQILNMASRRSSRLSAVSGNDSAKSLSTNGSHVVGKKRRAVEPGNTEKIPKDGFAVPSTPKRKKATKEIPPDTPTPAAAKLMGLPSRTEGANDGVLRTYRVADPHITNAPLLSPETSRVVANKLADALSPSKPPQSKTTTGNILEKACAHLISTDPRLKPLIEKHHCAIFSAEGLVKEIDPFRALTSGIISQQVGNNLLMLGFESSRRSKKFLLTGRTRSQELPQNPSRPSSWHSLIRTHPLLRTNRSFQRPHR
jgi:DNA-3-methyladenine glycosylase II